MKKIALMVLLALIASCGQKETASKSEARGKTESGTPAPPETNLSSQFGAGPQAPEEKFAALMHKAEAGDAKSQFILARMYYNGDGVAKDDAKAAEWYRKAAEQGNAFAQYKLGEMYDKGEGVAKDTAKAKEWWQKAADQGNDAAQESLKLLASKPAP